MILTDSTAQSAFSLAYTGDFQSAIDSLGDRWLGLGLEPRRGSDTDLEYAELLMVCGFLTTELGRHGLLRCQSVAKDLLSKAARLFGDDPRGQEARLWLALAYLWCGENNETVSLTDAILAEQTAESFVIFTAGHVRGLALLNLGRFSQAEDSFGSVEIFLETVPPLARGRFHLNRGMLYRQLGRLDDSLRDYELAHGFCRAAGSVRYQAAALNNAARIYAERGDYEQAHRSARGALAKFVRLRDRAHEALVLDQIAHIYAHQEKWEEMEQCASRAVEILSESDHEGWLAQALTTLGTARARLSLCFAEESFARALEICSRQADPGQAKITIQEMWNMVRCGKQFSEDFRESIAPLEKSVYELVLNEHGGLVSPAAHDLGYNHQAFLHRLQTRFPELLTKRRPPRQRRKSIFKPQ